MTAMDPRTSGSSGWFKSSYSSSSTQCVEVRFDGDLVLIRDSKYRRDPANDPAQEPIIAVPAESWAVFLDEAAGDAPPNTNNAVRIERRTDGGVELHAPHGQTTLTYTAAEWAAFVAGTVVGEFARPDTMAAT